MNIVLIAAVARNGVIGACGKMPWDLPLDLAHFKRTTMGSPVIMGRKTFESIGRPLPGRRNIVISNTLADNIPGVEVFSTHKPHGPIIDASFGENEIFVIGGSTIYELFIDAAKKMILTHVHASPLGDTYFPEFQKHEWDITYSEPYVDGGHNCCIATYTRNYLRHG